MTEREGPVVATGRGRVRGVVTPAPAGFGPGGAVAAFRGIPYAASPVGELRFAAPREHPVWHDVRDAAHSGPAVPQNASRLNAVMGHRVPDWDEEGCLNLNVWTPADALGAGSTPRPVLVWIHGGGFSSGSGGWDWYDGARLAALGDLTVVTINYRVGPLGYLHLPAVGAVNLGAQDQGAALRWVRENISAFGGDPGLVTVGGQSAGAHSALALATDPDTAALVRRVILQSAPLGLAPQESDDAAATAAAYVRLLGLAGAADVGKALRALPVEQLLEGFGQLMAGLTRSPGDVTPVMRPVLGGPGQPGTWQRALADGMLDGKDVLIGTVDTEMTAFLALDPRMRAFTPDEARDALSRLTDRLTTGAPARVEPLDRDVSPGQAFVERVGDLFFGDGTTKLAAHRAAHGTPAYVYRFTRRPDPDDLGLGCPHCAELPFLFNTFDAYPDAPMLGAVDDEDRALGRAFGGALAAFTATGSPNGEGLAAWHPYGGGPDPCVMRFGPRPR
ncbi:carboxylesterase/lipase family protein [Streptomyces sp. NPDC001691]|uniref:carboxylesterase/lipase family protein n=1 Tax=Streptomyces sp. NPDC001691 TaxID=3364600 RepID=UPI0036A70EEF